MITLTLFLLACGEGSDLGACMILPEQSYPDEPVSYKDACCTVDADCGGKFPVCSGEGGHPGHCVECESDRDCTSARFCGPQGFCVLPVAGGAR
jgi:hypothetical protein